MSMIACGSSTDKVPPIAGTEVQRPAEGGKWTRANRVYLLRHQNVIEVDLREVIRNALAHHDKVVRVCGWLRLEFEANAIYTSPAADDPQLSLAIETKDFVPEEGAKRVAVIQMFDRRLCVIEGTLTTDPTGVRRAKLVHIMSVSCVIEPKCRSSEARHPISPSFSKLLPPLS
jgi:hypothetical protein